MGFLKKLKHSYIWKRIFIERLTEALHLNILSIFLYFFGSLRSKIAFDLVLRQYHAYALLEAADLAKSHNKNEVTVIEFGVANGAGLYNIQKIWSNSSSTGTSYFSCSFPHSSKLHPYCPSPKARYLYFQSSLPDIHCAPICL